MTTLFRRVATVRQVFNIAPSLSTTLTSQYAILPQLSSRLFSTTLRPCADFTHAIIGGGAVGLSIANRLQNRSSTHSTPISTLLLERHSSVGTETSSRNSEVIHAGLYYGPDSLKTRLCLSGKQLLYDLCSKHDIPHKRCGKWIVAQDSEQHEALEKVHSFAQEMGIPTRWVGLEEARELEPSIRAREAVLESGSTGIVDSHSFMQYLVGDFSEAGGDVALNSDVVRIEALGTGNAQDGSGGWRIWTSGKDGEEESSVTAETLINAAGLQAFTIQNMILPESQHRQPYYCKGSYYSYSSSTPKPKRLIYPAPIPGHGGLGTHLTIDMAGQVRFGPDVEWVDDPTDYTPSGKGLAQALDDIETYLPGLRREDVHVDYCGIRPKLSRQSAQVHGKNFTDFVIEKPEGTVGFVNLVGIESPGLTSSLAIGEYVEALLYGDKKAPV